jgi:hypothetical protein
MSVAQLFYNDPNSLEATRKFKIDILPAQLAAGSAALAALNINSRTPLSRLFRDVVHVTNSSGSDSLFLRARLAKNPQTCVFLKIQCLPPDLTVENSGQVEAGTYLQQVDVQLRDRITPHLLAALGYLVYNDLETSLAALSFAPAGADVSTDPQVKPLVRADAERDDMEDGNTRKTRDFRADALKKWRELLAEAKPQNGAGTVLVLEEDWHSVTLYHICRQRALLHIPVLASVLWQLVYTLAAFSEADPPLRHNDLHLMNVLVDKVANEELTYVLGRNEAYRVPTNGCMVRVFDFDFAYRGRKNTKTEGEICHDYGSCNQNNALFDAFFVLRLVYQMLPYASQQAFPAMGSTLITSGFTGFPKLLRKEARGDHRMCHVAISRSNPNATECDGEIRPDELARLRLPPPLEMLRAVGRDKGYLVPMNAVDLQAPTTFFVSHKVRLSLLGQKPSKAKKPYFDKETKRFAPGISAAMRPL